MSAIPEVTDKSFTEEVIQSNKTTLVDFWAPWCMPCRMMTPILEQLSKEAGDTVKIVKVNTDENQMTAAKYGIMSIPSLVFFKGGSEVGRTVGVQPVESLKAALDKIGQKGV